MSVAVQWVQTREEFESLTPGWDSLLPQDATPFDLHCWYAAWLDSFLGDCEPAVCVARRNGEPAGILPLMRCGRDLRALANAHSPLFRPLARDDEALDALVAAAASRVKREVELVGLPQEDPVVERLAAGVRRGGLVANTEAGQVSPFVDTSGDLESWRKQSKSRWGAPLERFRRKMGRDHEARFEIVVPPRDLEAELEDGFAVEASGWKGEAGTAIVSSPQTESFYRGIARAFHERDELRFSRIVLDGQTAAFDFTVLHGGRLYLLKTGFDERFRKLAPGLVMRLSIVERCFEMGLRSHELLGHESEWKRKFATGERRHVDLRAYPRNPLGLARYGYRSSARPALKRAYGRLRAVRS